MAGDAGERRGGEIYYRGCDSLRKSSGLGANGSLYAAQSALPLDAPRVAALFRHHGVAGREVRAGDLGARERDAGRQAERARDLAEISRRGRVYYGRSHGRPATSSSDREVESGNAGV